MIKIIFLGTSDFAVPSLRALVNDERFEVVAVVTQPDRPKGRKQILTPPPVKIAAQELGISEILQPNKLKEQPFYDRIREIGPTTDLFVVAAYGKILPQWFLDLPKHGSINVHGSLLPRWRGASPVQAAIAAGDTESGVTIMQMDAELDHGDIVATTSTKIGDDETGGELHDRLADLGAKILPDTLAGFLSGNITPQKQNDEAATFCRTFTREDGKIDWTKSAEEIERMIRAYNPWPGTWMDWNGARLKIIAAEILTDSVIPTNAEGSLFVKNNAPCVACGNNSTLKITTLQPDGKRAMSGEEFLKGNTWSS